jgi:hypothetical protein
VSTLLSRGDLTPEDEYIIKWTSMSIYAGGSDTVSIRIRGSTEDLIIYTLLPLQSVSIVLGFFLAMALNPHVLKKAQEEIDNIIGSHRLPSISDRSQLPYIDALVREVFRWNVVLPIGQPWFIKSIYDRRVITCFQFQRRVP